jgi:hypothetical protein
MARLLISWAQSEQAITKISFSSILTADFGVDLLGSNNRVCFPQLGHGAN